ncbi:MAG: hypothetical protein ABDH49_04565 [Candidatus Hydrothermales bacterium]
MKKAFIGGVIGIIGGFMFTGLIPNFSGKRENPSLLWIGPRMGWEVDYTNNRIYAIDNSGGVTPSVGIGTNSPLSRFHLVGDFYNQGFVGTQSYYEPPGISWANVASLSYTSHGSGEDNSVVLIYAHLISNTSGGYVDGFIRVLRGNTPIAIACGGGYYDVWSGLSAFFGVTLIAYDNPPPGTHTYTLQRESVIPQYGYTFYVIELKR